MITSELKDGIVWLTIEGEMISQDVITEVSKWLLQKNTFSGFITDIRNMDSIPSGEEQKKLEAWRQHNKSGKPHAILGRTNAESVLVQIFIRLTKAADTRYFMRLESAITWVKNFDR